jgi:D-alanyl-D-alanine dipeptidase
MLKPYHHIPIVECGEPLIAIPDRPDLFELSDPHPYQKLGADYQGRSPFMLRSGVVDALMKAVCNLQSNYPHWRLLIFDAYRPLTVQRFMVEYSFGELCQARQLAPHTLSAQQEGELRAEVAKFWAIPSDDPHTPPPHSTGAAIDVSLIAPNGAEADMGSPIDEISDRSHPDYFRTIAPHCHYHRQMLAQAMVSAGFSRHPNEWWHFSMGDQLWAWQTAHPHARYGRVSHTAY